MGKGETRDAANLIPLSPCLLRRRVVALPRRFRFNGEKLCSSSVFHQPVVSTLVSVTILFDLTEDTTAANRSSSSSVKSIFEVFFHQFRFSISQFFT
ncbi:hypothetical protein F2Q70_00013132 [Brassica cretica]|uniref:Uncharacterized protein n=1 Tax=Brassica cretica TaxID=69181 RepID=A0A8S9M350_BRACR|nr:hypothetical protein F2Q70_00013132 [Brassica cretica]